MIELDKIVAIDLHVRADVSNAHPESPVLGRFFQAASDNLNDARQRPTMPEIAQYYRQQHIAFCLFPLDCEYALGAKTVSNEEVAQFAAENSDTVIPFASIDPHKGLLGVQQARYLIEAFGVKGFVFHPPLQKFSPQDSMAYSLYEVIAEHQLTAIFHTGHTRWGTGMPGGGGIQLKRGQPILVDDVAVAFPEMNIVLSHTGWPWTDEALSMSLHKPNVYLDLSGWSPKRLPPQLIQYANDQLGKKILLGTDYPVVRPDVWMSDAKAVGFNDVVLNCIVKDNAAQLLGLQ